VRTNHQLTEFIGPSYISPYGGKTAQLRNMRLAQIILQKKLLEDSKCAVERLQPSQNTSPPRILDMRQLYWTSTAWLIIYGIFAILAVTDSSWIGFANCVLCCAQHTGVLYLDLLWKHCLTSALLRVNERLNT
jgi:hypothetical protein